MKHIQRLLAVALVAVAVSMHASDKPYQLDPSKPMNVYVLASWRDTSGLPVDSVSSIVQTRDGYLWIGTEHGLVRFDGVRFTLFNTANTPQLRSNEIYTLYVSRDGKLWIGTRGGGALTYDGSRFDRVSVRYRYIVGFAESRDGSVWIGAPGGIARVRGSAVKTFEKEQGYPGGRLEAIAADDTGVYVAMSPGVMRIDERGARTWTQRDGLSAFVKTLDWTPEHGLLAGTTNGSVDQLRGDRFEPLMRTHDGNAISSILHGTKGTLWLSTIGGGLVRYANGRVDALTTRDGLTSDSLTSLFEDDEGNLWLGTTGGGLVRVAQGSITSILPESLSASWVLALVHAPDGSVWFTTSGGGLYRLHDGEVSRFTKGLRGSMITSLAADRDGIWIGTDDGLQRWIDGKIVNVADERLRHGAMHAMTVARDGTLWVSGDTGLHLVRGNEVRTLTEKDGMRPGTVIAVRQAPDGSMWFAKPNAVEHYVNGVVTACYTSEQGLRTRVMAGITIDEHDGSIWVPTMGSGLGRIYNGHVQTYRVEDGLLSDSMYTVVQDQAGDLWISTGLGLMQIRRADLAEYDARHTQRLRTHVFRKADGLKSNDFSGGFDRAGFRAPDGRLWFPTTRGLAVVQPSQLHTDQTPPRVGIESVLAGGLRAIGGPIDLPPDERNLEIEYTAPSFHAPESTVFRYKLEGIDKEWHDAGTRRTAYYTNLPPGKYRFIVEARTSENQTAQASVPIELMPHFHETLLFHVGVTLIILLLALMAHRVRIERVRRHQAELRKSEEHFRSLIENASDLILLISRDGTISYASPSVSRVLGSAPDALHGRPLNDVVVSAESVAQFFECVHTRGRCAATLVFKDAGGAEREIESIGALALDDPETIVLNCRDITDRRRLESQLAQANRLSSLGRLAATISHEFNNVLMGIQPFVEIVRRRSSDDTVQHATVQMRRSLDRGKRIAEQILRFTRPADPTLEAVSARTWLLDVELEIRALVGPNVRVAIVVPPGLAVQADVAQLNQVIANLAINARDAGATRIALEAYVAEGDGVYPFGIVSNPEQFVHLMVRDDGSGIPESVLPHIFEPLFTTKTTKGTGLGLAVAQQVVAKHGGEIFVESRVGSGTTFHLFLRRATTAVEEEPDMRISDANGESQRCRVLLVEDDSSVAEGIVTTLESDGFDVDLAINGGDALHHIARNLPDIVVLDVGLPDINGLEVYSRIRKQWPALPVIFSTAHVDPSMLHESMDPPYPPCLLKPYEVDTLVRTIVEAMKEANAVVVQS